MIAFLDGTLAQSFPTHVTVDVSGVGYEVLIPLSSYDRLPLVGQRIRLLTHLQVREDAHILYGFMTDGERDLFRLLLNNVSGVGPKLALAVLSGMSVANFKSAVVAGDTAAISKMKGLGKKTADETLCSMCHLGEFAGQNEIPKVAGQHPEYVIKQLMDFKNRVRTNDAGNMASVSKTLSAEDMENIAHYIATLY